MENMAIPDDFYIFPFNNCIYHKSCVIVNDKGYDEFSNGRFVCSYKPIEQSDIDTLRDICNMHDVLNEKTYFKERVYDNLCVRIRGKNHLYLYNDNIYFNDINKLLEYLAENYPECIRNDEIKIALKD
jgi:hypothetical protein